MSGVNRELKWYTYAGDFFNTLKAFIGTNYQSLPFAFANSGLGFGIGGLFIVAMLTDHCIQIMLRCKNVFIEKICSNSVAVKSVDDADVPRLRERLQLSVSYGDLGQKVYGSWCFHLIQFAVWFTQFMTCIGYFIFIGNTVYEMFPLREPSPSSQNSSNLTGDGTVMDSNDDVNDGVQISVYSHLVDLPDTSLLLGERNATVIYISTAPDLRIIVTWCIPIFIVTSLVRKVRYLAPLSFIATIALVLGILSVLAFLISGFTISNFVWYRFETLPMFLTQMISAYEGIGCILPIHCSMVGCRHMLSRYVHANVYIIFVILGVFGTLGYMRYGPNVEQILVKEITQHTLLSLLVDATLIVSVIFTYPLQCYPVIEIMESYLLAPGACCRKTHSDRLEYDEITVDSPESVLPLSEGSPLVHENASVELTASQISTTVALPRVASWKRNVLRVTLTLVVALLAVLLRNNYAYLASFTGALGCSLLSFILPCLIELKLRGSEMSYICIVKDITIIVLSVIISIAGLISVIVTLAQGRKPV